MRGAADVFRATLGPAAAVSSADVYSSAGHSPQPATSDRASTLPTSTAVPRLPRFKLDESPSPSCTPLRASPFSHRSPRQAITSFWARAHHPPGLRSYAISAPDDIVPPWPPLVAQRASYILRVRRAIPHAAWRHTARARRSASSLRPAACCGRERGGPAAADEVSFGDGGARPGSFLRCACERCVAGR
jgi:hypothetical protein